MVRHRALVACVLACVILAFAPLVVSAQAGPGFVLPKITLGVEAAQRPSEVAVSLQVLLLLTVLSLAPAALVMLTGFVRISIVFSFARMALATQQMPPNQVLMGLALFLTIFVMAPTFKKINEEALQPFLAQKISADQFYSKGIEPLRVFMLKQTREKDIALFMHLAKEARPKTQADIPTYVLIPAFIVSEITTAFKIGVIIFVPFIIIDMVVASVLMAMGMIMLPPVMISMPFKIIVFYLVDGWNLLIQKLVEGFY